MPASLTVIARRFLFVRETEGANSGAWVNLFQRFTGNVEGDSWCASFISYVLDVAYHGKSPISKSASAEALYVQCLNMIVSNPVTDDIFFFHDGVRAHHVGIVATVASAARVVTGIAGNTSADGASSNGDGVYEHLIPIQHARFARLPR